MNGIITGMGERDRQVLESLCRELSRSQFDRDGYKLYSEALYAVAVQTLELALQGRLYVKNAETGEIEIAEGIEI